VKISFENHVYFGRKISAKIFSKACAFNNYLLFELMQNIKAKRHLERSFYMDLERFYFLSFLFLVKHVLLNFI